MYIISAVCLKLFFFYLFKDTATTMFAQHTDICMLGKHGGGGIFNKWRKKMRIVNKQLKYGYVHENVNKPRPALE